LNRILVEFAPSAALFTGTVQTPRAALPELAPLVAALPTPVLATILAARHHTYRSEAASTFVLSSLCLLVTLPFWML
jgi:predicted permease